MSRYSRPDLLERDCSLSPAGYCPRAATSVQTNITIPETIRRYPTNERTLNATITIPTTISSTDSGMQQAYSGHP